MRKTILGVLLSLHFLFALSPILSIEVNGTVKDMVLRDNELVIGTDNGLLQVYNYKTKQFIQSIKVPKVKDFMGDLVQARVYSVDKIAKQYLLVSESGESGYSNLWIYKDKQKKQLVSATDKKAIVKARFINENHILLAFLSNEVVLFNIKNKKELYRTQLNESKFSDFSLNLDKSQAVFACESGILSIVDTKRGIVQKELYGVNKDNVYKVAFRKDIITGAGQDRRASIYNVKKGTHKFIAGSFLIYATGISPSSKLIAFALDEQNTISIFNAETKEKLFTLKGQKSTLNNIIFKTEEILFSSSDDSTILMWNLQNK
jgi:WD40 repeat protein